MASKTQGQFEETYQAAVQSFVRRDHGRTQPHLQRLLHQCEPSLHHAASTIWYDLSQNEISARPTEDEERIIKTLKLVISSYTSLYSDPPSDRSHFTPTVRALLPPSPPDILLKHVLSICQQTSGSDILPPSIVASFLLSSITLRPSGPSLRFAHNLVEQWLTDLPDSFILAISSIASRVSSPGTNGITSISAEGKKRIESAREGYLKVVELFVGEILAREGEYEMGRGLLDGDMIMSSKRKEVCNMIITLVMLY